MEYLTKREKSSGNSPNYLFDSPPTPKLNSIPKQEVIGTVLDDNNDLITL